MTRRDARACVCVCMCVYMCMCGVIYMAGPRVSMAPLCDTQKLHLYNLSAAHRGTAVFAGEKRR